MIHIRITCEFIQNHRAHVQEYLKKRLKTRRKENFWPITGSYRTTVLLLAVATITDVPDINHKFSLNIS